MLTKINLCRFILFLNTCTYIFIATCMIWDELYEVKKP